MQLLIPIFIVIFVIIVSSSRRKQASVAWQAAAQKLDLQYVKGGRAARHSISGYRDGLSVEIRTLAKGSGDARKTHTRYVISAPPLGLNLLVRQAGVMDRLKNMIGAGDVILGDQDFDSRYTVRGAPTSEVQRLLNRDKRQEIDAVLSRLRGARVLDDRVTFERRGIERSSSRLVRTALTLSDLARSLRENRDSPRTPSRSTLAERWEAQNSETVAASAAAAAVAVPVVAGERVVLEELDSEPVQEPSVAPPPPSAAEPLPAEPLPAEPLPAEPLPAEPLPAEPLPAEPLPAEPLPADRLPADPLPAEHFPAEHFPAEHFPEEHFPEEPFLDEPFDAEARPDPEYDPEPAPAPEPEVAHEPEPALSPPPSPTGEAVGSALVVQALFRELFGEGRMGSEVEKEFQRRFEGRALTVDGRLERWDTYRFDRHLGRGPGPRANLVVEPPEEFAGQRPLQVQLAAREDLSDWKVGAGGDSVRASGILVACDPYMRRVYLKEGRVELAPS